MSLLTEDRRCRRDWARRARAAFRRDWQATPAGTFLVSAREQRRVARNAAREIHRLRTLVDHAHRALERDAWNEVYSNLVDAAAIMRDWGGVVDPSRDGFTVVAADEDDL